MNPLIAAVGVVVVMALAVVATMAVENWRQFVRPVPTRGRLDADDAPEAASADHEGAATWGPVAGPELVPDVEIVALAAPADDAAAADDRDDVAAELAPQPAADEPPVPAVHVPPAGAPEGAIAVSGRSVELRDRATADVLAALLFAGLASTRRSGADRAAAWVTATATPPTADPDRFPPGVRLRGRTAKVAELLAHRDGGAVWIGMQPGVDIARGLARTPVTQPTLGGLVAWWSSTRDLPAVVEPATAAEIAASLDAVRDQLDTTPWSEVVGRLRDALAAAAEDDEPLLVSLAGADADAAVASAGAGDAVSGGPRRAAPTR
ncbi:hypothetical protein [Dermatobacter hominis]|uniref:hypothetical protein n=1 Tax=Dermatobacter hominis TaxID=2884263 RepID=UPI001D10E8BE|nr:hypothetical protein [Dermatobacter hominis]UDY35937.1 hypothetical protein LH044_21790 [Dermatobacter hominis]